MVYGENRPTHFREFVRPIKSSMRTAEIITNSGPAYIKAMGGPQGNDPLACEWIGTSLARWFGLPTFDFAILNLIDGDEVLFHDKGKADLGPAFVTRAVEDGDKCGGSDAQLTLLDNPEAISWLVVLDTWLRNYDRIRLLWPILPSGSCCPASIGAMNICLGLPDKTSASTRGPATTA